VRKLFENQIFTTLIPNNYRLTIYDIIDMRKNIESAKGNVGLFWFNSNLTKIVLSKKAQVKYANQSNNGEWVTVLKSHDNVYNSQSGDFIKSIGGEVENKYSLPRGFISYNSFQDLFMIIGGDWLTVSIAKKIVSEFNLDPEKVVLKFGTSGFKGKKSLFKLQDYNVKSK